MMKEAEEGDLPPPDITSHENRKPPGGSWSSVSDPDSDIWLDLDSMNIDVGIDQFIIWSCCQRRGICYIHQPEHQWWYR